MSVLSDITFFHVALSLIGVGVIERLLYCLPDTLVGPGGTLLDTGTTEKAAVKVAD